jgi:hypothetical protein
LTEAIANPNAIRVSITLVPIVVVAVRGLRVKLLDLAVGLLPSRERHHGSNLFDRADPDPVGLAQRAIDSTSLRYAQLRSVDERQDI